MTFALAMLQIAYSSLMVLFTGYTYSCLWNWFVVTTFQAPVVNIPTAIGLALFVTMFHKITPKDMKESQESDYMAAQNTAMFLKPTMVLLVAYVAKAFM